MSFLKAEWRKLAVVNYLVDPQTLEKYLPYGTKLDLWEGKCFVSIVAFMFQNTRVLGLKVPFHVNFEEVNLRFYVKYGEKRGVVFIKEIVPKFAITFIANTLYNENYVTLPMKHDWQEHADHRICEYGWKTKKWNRVRVEADLTPTDIKKGSEVEFITEHFWGYAKANENKTREYGVTHPTWKQYNVKNYDLEIDFLDNYGKDFQMLNSTKPHSVMLAEGSKITVEKGTVIRRK